MATKTIDEIFDEYRLYLKGLKPLANVDQDDSDWWIRGRTFAGVVSGVYADIEKNALDVFPQHARREALLRWIFAYFNENVFAPATVSSGDVAVTGDALAAFTTGLQATHAVTGNVYAITADGALDGAGEGTAHIQSLLAGQAQNLTPGTVLTIGSPPAGIDSTVTVVADANGAGIAGGTNEEDEERAARRVLARMRLSARGGNVNDYQVWALSIAGVTGVNILRYVLGLGTVGVFITSGTTDIDSAVDNDETIDFTPSGDVIDAVQNYLESVCPETDCPFTYAAEMLEIDVLVRAKFTSGDKDTILSGQTLTQGELLTREIRRAIYKLPMGGTLIDDQGYVSKKSVQDAIDSKLGAAEENNLIVGDTLQIVVDRVLSFPDADDFELVNVSCGRNERPVPGTITVSDW